MTDVRIIAAITVVCALVLVGRGLVRRPIAPSAVAGPIAIWAAVIAVGMVLARLWLSHHDRSR